MSSGSVPTPPKFKPASFTALDPNSLRTIDPATANALGTQYDKIAYNTSDADFAARHPELAQANKLNESQVLSDVQGNVPVGLQQQLLTAGLSTPAASFGAGIVPGSTGQFGAARAMGIDYSQYRGMIGNELAGLNAQDPERTFGIGGQGALNLALNNDQQFNAVTAGNQQGMNETAIANATGQNASNQGGFAGALQAYSNQQANNRAAISTGISAAASIGSVAAQYGGAALGMG